MTKYTPRIVDALLQRKLAGMGAVLVQGAKWCGKTTTCEQIAKSALYMTDPKYRAQYLAMADMDVTRLMEGPQPRLIDEWQDAPKFWDAIRFDVDHAEGFGHYILTGSAVPPEDDDKEISHSGTGRIARLTMRPMSLWESGESSGEVSLAALFQQGEAFKAVSAKELTLDEMAEKVCRGGWPQAVKQPRELALDRALDYYDAVVNVDIERAEKTIRDPERVKRLMRSYARLQGTQSGLKAIRLDMAGNDEKTLDESTVASYIKALKRIFVVEDMPAWSPSLRSKAVVRSSDTRYFTDPSIATASLGLGPKDLVNDLRSFGFFFETLVMRDLRVYAQALNGEVYHYHDSTGLECDGIVHLRNGDSGLVEVKLGGDDLIEEGAATLTSLAKRLKYPPAFCLLMTAVGAYAYRRPDGIIVCPITALKD